MTRALRRPARPVRVGRLAIGGDHPILIQSMTTTDTLDTEGVVREITALVRAGCPLVRVTVPSVRAAENLPAIRAGLRRCGVEVPLIADIHFTPAAALVAAEHCEKVRINPGNYVDPRRSASQDDPGSEDAAARERVRERLAPLVRKLQERGGALRIGVNHGSLSERILRRYGDTPEGMVASALEFVRLCESLEFREIVLSMKSSIPSVMVAANRLLVRRMHEEGIDYPIHLGVTEAGGGLEGRIKSAIGIGALLLDGIGDTIRVSLTEDSVHEIEACRAILRAVEQLMPQRPGVEGRWSPPPMPPEGRRKSRAIAIGSVEVGGEAPPRIEAALRRALWDPNESAAALEEARLLLEGADRSASPQGAEILGSSVPPTSQPSRSIAPVATFHEGLLASFPETPVLLEWDLRSPGEIHALEPLLPYTAALGVRFPLAEELSPSRVALLARLARRTGKPLRLRLEPDGEPAPAEEDARRAGEMARRLAEICIEEGTSELALLVAGWNLVASARAVAAALDASEATRSIPLFLELPEEPITAAVAAGALLLDGVGDALRLTGKHVKLPGPEGGVPADPVTVGYAILQGCRLRLTRAEFIACPSCGRTQFDLQATARRIQEATAHLRGVKIAIMGCIVNGPGEMADADFGYVGSGPGQIDLYAGRTRVARSVPVEKADQRLIELIREKGKWIDPPVEER